MLLTLDERLLALGIGLLVALLLAALTPLHSLLFLDAPRRVIHSVFYELIRKMNRQGRSSTTLYRRGFIVCFLVILLALVAGWLSSTLTRLDGWYGLPDVVLIAYLLLPLAADISRMQSTYQHIHTGNLEAARISVAGFHRRDTHTADQATLIRTTVEAVAIALVQTFMGRVVAYIIAGAYGLALYAAIELLQRYIAMHAHSRSDAFGRWPVRMMRIMLALPVRIGGVVLAISAMFAPGVHVGKAFSALLDSLSTPHEESGAPAMAVMAGGLGIALGGNRTLNGHTVERRWLEYGTPRPGSGQLQRARYWACACLVVVLLIVMLCYTAMTHGLAV